MFCLNQNSQALWNCPLVLPLSLVDACGSPCGASLNNCSLYGIGKRRLQMLVFFQFHYLSRHLQFRYFAVRFHQGAVSILRFLNLVTVTSHEYHGICNPQWLDCLFNSVLGATLKKNKKKQTNKALQYWPFVRGIHQWRIPYPKGQWHGKHFHFMTSSCAAVFLKFCTVPCTAKFQEYYITKKNWNTWDYFSILCGSFLCGKSDSCVRASCRHIGNSHPGKVWIFILNQAPFVLELLMT